MNNIKKIHLLAINLAILICIMAQSIYAAHWTNIYPSYFEEENSSDEEEIIISQTSHEPANFAPNMLSTSDLADYNPTNYQYNYIQNNQPQDRREDVIFQQENTLFITSLIISLCISTMPRIRLMLQV